ncbi:hypothetical protein [Romboutsia sp.]|uniref:hypothetical protein n=1 Tax=Romboutsia sp. TaxID=1965302 RepID=UPI002CB106FA|nr:hypothetical protein [Romboutsia sp.]HSQ88165.1 hypothetical protein [Romboutsia sp.]
MNLKRALVSVVVLSIFITGCSKQSTREESTIADEATQQKTMTKVQNDVNEIMNKDYEYILKNMGTPYCTTYYVDMENGGTLGKLDETSNMRLIYPKYTSDNELEGSALYIELSNNKVTEVQTYEFSDYNIEIEAVSNNVDIIIDKYNEESGMLLKKVENIDLNDYIGKSEDELYNIVGENVANIEAYDKTRNQNVKAYFLKDENKNSTKTLTVFGNENNIEEIKVVHKDEIMNLVQKYLYKY